MCEVPPHGLISSNKKRGTQLVHLLSEALVNPYNQIENEAHAIRRERQTSFLGCFAKIYQIFRKQANKANAFYMYIARYS